MQPSPPTRTERAAPAARASGTRGSLADVTLSDASVLRCFSPPDLAIHKGDLCVVETGRVQEYGRITHMELLENSQPARGLPSALRRATLQDQSREQENQLRGRMALETCKQKIAEHKLEMTLISVRYSFDRSVLVVVFTSEGRVDFRELVKDLAGEFGVRVEMKQIGVRDAAGMIGGIGACGRLTCCCSWLKKFETVNVRMAKAQRLSLNPNTISGMCGRLKCCLRYEHECYLELNARLPRQGGRVECRDGVGRVIDKNILGQTVKIRLADDRVVECRAEDVCPAPSGASVERRPRENPRYKRSESRSAGQA